MQQPFIKLSENEFGDVRLKYIDSNCDSLAEEFQSIALAKNDLHDIAKMILAYCDEEGIIHELGLRRRFMESANKTSNSKINLNGYM